MSLTPTKSDNLEVTGVSRCGRVRKKSSKLADFRTNYDTESSTTINRSKNATVSKSAVGNVQHTSSVILPSPSLKRSNDVDDLPKSTRSSLSETHEFTADDLNSLENSSFDFEDDFLLSVKSDQPNEEDTDYDGFSIDQSDIDTTVRKSAYMAEKTTRKKVFKDGRIVLGRLQRKDKGKPRFTSYMLWAREMRQDMLNSNPSLDFATQSRRLSEMWANMPPSDKFIWRKKAKRLAVTKSPFEKPFTANTITTTAVSSSSSPMISKFLNKIGNPKPIRRPGRPPKVKKVGRKPKIDGNLISKNKKIERKIKKINKKSLLNLISTPTKPKKTIRHATTTASSSAEPILQPKKAESSSVTPGPYRVTGLGPSDVAAHLKLLGDNLTIIGERLKEHEGQITVSGSLSVLLDSLLCSLGPLMCLTPFIPGVDVPQGHLRNSLSSTLDNIAYVMPGL